MSSESEEHQLERTRINGDIIYRGDRKVVSSGTSKAVTLPKQLLSTLFKTKVIVGVRFEALRNTEGIVQFLLTPLVEIGLEREE